MTKNELSNFSTDKKLKMLIIKTYPFLNNGESYEDDSEVIFEHYIGARQSFKKTEEWKKEHELMFSFILRESSQFKNTFQRYIDLNLASELELDKQDIVPDIKIDELLKN